MAAHRPERPNIGHFVNVFDYSWAGALRCATGGLRV